MAIEELRQRAAEPVVSEATAGTTFTVVLSDYDKPVTVTTPT